MPKAIAATNWSAHVPGTAGLLLGWSLPIKAVVRNKAKAALAQFMEKGIILSHKVLGGGWRKR